MIDIKKTYKTRDGREVRIYATDGGGDRPVHGAVINHGEWFLRHWSAKGTMFPDHEHCSDDLIEMKPRIQREVWVNVHKDRCTVRKTKETADLLAVTGPHPRLACVKIVIDVDEGEGL
jgi:hypothetical protein